MKGKTTTKLAKTKLRRVRQKQTRQDNVTTCLARHSVGQSIHLSWKPFCRTKVMIVLEASQSTRQDNVSHCLGSPLMHSARQCKPLSQLLSWQPLLTRQHKHQLCLAVSLCESKQLGRTNFLFVLPSSLSGYKTFIINIKIESYSLN